MGSVVPLRQDELLKALHRRLAQAAEEALTILDAVHGHRPFSPDASTNAEERRRLFMMGAAWGWRTVKGRLAKEPVGPNGWARLMETPPVEALLQQARLDMEAYQEPDIIETEDAAGLELSPPTRNRLAFWLGLSYGISSALRLAGLVPDDGPGRWN